MALVLTQPPAPPLQSVAPVSSRALALRRALALEPQWELALPQSQAAPPAAVVTTGSAAARPAQQPGPATPQGALRVTGRALPALQMPPSVLKTPAQPLVAASPSCAMTLSLEAFREKRPVSAPLR